jgi:4-amino-4-deoxy-L-arabinose transferase-like glycosyltransferase
VTPPERAAPPPQFGDAKARYERVLTLSVLAFLFLLYLPLAGNYGLWDPWETHYGEVGRQMASRNDWINLWWPGSPQDPPSGVFWSKPVLTFWIMAIFLKLFGLGHSDPAHGSEMVMGWRAEWALRVPFVLLGIVGILATYHLVQRLASRRAAVFSALALATSAQWALITRQAMTDMPFVVPMTVAIVFAGLALIPARREATAQDAADSTPEMTAVLPRRSVRLGPLELS